MHYSFSQHIVNIYKFQERFNGSFDGSLLVEIQIQKYPNSAAEPNALAAVSRGVDFVDTHYALHEWNDISLKTLAYEWKLVGKISEF